MEFAKQLITVNKSQIHLLISAIEEGENACNYTKLSASELCRNLNTVSVLCIG
jgi:hypothetical protein